MAKATPWTKTDAQVRKHGEQTGLDTLVVHAVNDVDLKVADSYIVAFVANALNRPPGKYGRKAKTQMN